MPFQSVNSITQVAGAAVAAKRFVKKDGSGDAIQAAAATDEVIGVSLAAAAAAGDAFEVAKMDGCRVEVEAGAAVTAGADVTSDTVGRAVAAGTDNAVAGFAETAADAAGEIITIVALKGSLAAP